MANILGRRALPAGRIGALCASHFVDTPLAYANRQTRRTTTSSAQGGAKRPDDMLSSRGTIPMRNLMLIPVACAMVACNPRSDPADADSSSWPITVDSLEVPSTAKSAQPQLTTSNRGVILSWLEHQGSTVTLKFAERTAAGWSPARAVASGDSWFVSWADVPSVLRMSNGTLVAHWYTNTDVLLEAYDLWLAYSRDDGATWSPPFMPHDDGTTTQHGFATLFELPGEHLGLVWLDGRAMELDRSGDGPMSLRYAAYDTGWTRIADMPVDDRVCECCPTAAVVTPEGVTTVFRDRSLREIRDIHVSRLENGAWSQSRPVHVDNWRVPACPVNGPALGAAGRQLAVAWFTAREDQPRTFAAFSGDAGRTWGDPIRLDAEASRGQVAIAMLDDGSAAASWVEFASQRSALHVRRIEASGRASDAVDVTGGTGNVSGIPRMARHGQELVFAWTEGSEGGEQRIRGAVVRLPHTPAP